VHKVLEINLNANVLFFPRKIDKKKKKIFPFLAQERALISIIMYSIDMKIENKGETLNFVNKPNHSHHKQQKSELRNVRENP
jgi:hypothetical protein